MKTLKKLGFGLLVMFVSVILLIYVVPFFWAHQSSTAASAAIGIAMISAFMFLMGAAIVYESILIKKNSDGEK